MKGILKVAKIIAYRDRIDLNEAKIQVEEAMEMVMENLDDPEEAQQIWQNETGLEPDYMIELMGY